MRLVVLLLSVLALALPGAAQAGTVELGSELFGYGTVGELVYRAAPGERNNVTVTVDGTTVTVADKAGVKAGNGCRRAPDRTATCRLAVAPDDFGGFWSAELNLGDRDDLVHPMADFAGVTLVGGPGNDRLWGGDSSVHYNRFVGGPGRDVMRGEGLGNDFDEGTRANGADTMIAPSGWVDYGWRARPVLATLDGKRNDGERGERDRLGLAIDSVRGGKAADRLRGNERANQLVGGLGRDVLVGGAGDDALVATQVPGAGRVPLKGVTAGGRDALFGGPGNDFLEGSTGANLLAPGSGPDQIWTAGGADRVRAADGDVDEIRCSGGRERVTLDAVDFWRGCGGLGPGGGPVALSLDADVIRDDPEPYRAFVSVGCSGRAASACSGVVRVLLDGEEIGRAAFAVDPDLYDLTTAQVAVSKAGFPLVENRDPRVSIVVTRAGTAREFSLGVAHLADGVSPTVPWPPHPF